MASSAELKSVLRETLEGRGVLDQLKARVRAEVFNALDDQGEPKPALSHENLLINELIREYLEFNKYNYTCSVFLTETGQPREALDRKFLEQELKLHVAHDRNSSSVPLLYTVLNYLQKAPTESESSVSKQHKSEIPLTSTHTHHMQQPSLSTSSYHPASPNSDLTQQAPVIVKGGKVK